VRERQRARELWQTQAVLRWLSVLLVLALPACKDRASELEPVDPAMPDEASEPAMAPAQAPSDAAPARRSLEAVGAGAMDAGTIELTATTDAGPPPIEVPDVIGEP